VTAGRVRPPRAALGALALFLSIGPCLSQELTTFTPMRARLQLGPEQLAVVVNTADPLSVAIGAYYVAERHIPQINIVRVRFNYQRDELPDAEFRKIKSAVDRQSGVWIQAYALTWARPYRVGCMSITSAFAFGLHPEYCASGCGLTKLSAYYDSATRRPYEDLQIRPTMSLAALNLDQAKALIDQGVRADHTQPQGTAYLVSTSDPERNLRTVEYALAATQLQGQFKLERLAEAEIKDKSDVMFYFTGAARVPALDSNHFLPGSVADHLTSFGGMLTDSTQMSSLAWLQAGATGSYGTVVEPCNILGKFPDVPVLMKHYLAGEALIEAYWKSVIMPGQGLFIGEPLAAPFRRELAAQER
jgi:uncharacterized protein (TIGR03790 family)